MGQKAAVFCHNGLGDGVNYLVLSNNLHLNGFEVHTYHNLMGPMQHWVPHLPISPYPSVDELPKILHTYDWFFVVWDEKCELVRKLVIEGKRRFPDKIKVLYIYPSPRIINEPYYTDCLTNPNVSVAKNIRTVCEQVMHLPKITKSNGFIIPEGLEFRKFPKRLVIHPTSSRIARNWDKNKFVKLALHLKSQGYQPVFIPGSADLENWRELPSLGLELADFPSLDGLARFIYESGYLIGNDSGLGHLASALGIHTLTFCRRKSLARLWAPSFCPGVVLTPSSLVPNFRGFRIRDKYWQKFVTLGMAKRAFERLTQVPI